MNKQRSDKHETGIQEQKSIINESKTKKSAGWRQHKKEFVNLKTDQ